MDRVYGQTIKKIGVNCDFTLKAYTTYDGDSDIAWYSDRNLYNLINIGSSITLNAHDYNNGDIIYANIYDTAGVESLKVVLDIIETYTPTEDRQVTIKPVDIDSIYFKFYKCLSGVCYNYFREIEGIYEENKLVSDGEGAYNMYNEFDIIDEFFSNSHEAHVACDSNVDLSIKANYLDGVKMHIGTRVLLYKQTERTEIGVYVVQNDFTLKKTDELLTESDIFRYKVHIGAGTYLDKEFHINGFSSSGNDVEVIINKVLRISTVPTNIQRIDSNGSFTYSINVSTEEVVDNDVYFRIKIKNNEGKEVENEYVWYIQSGQSVSENIIVSESPIDEAFNILVITTPPEIGYVFERPYLTIPVAEHVAPLIPKEKIVIIGGYDNSIYFDKIKGTNITVDWGNDIITFYESEFSIDINENINFGGGDTVIITADKITELELLGELSINSVDFSEAPNLIKLVMGGESITNIDLSNNTNLEYLNINYNYNLTTLDLSNNTKLKTISIENLPLTYSQYEEVVISIDNYGTSNGYLYLGYGIEIYGYDHPLYNAIESLWSRGWVVEANISF